MKSKKKKLSLDEYILFELFASYVNDDPQYDQDEVNDLLKNLPSLPVDFPYENDVNDEFENDQYQQFYTSYEDDPVYSDDVQDAFAQYEQEVQSNLDLHIIYFLFLVF